MRRRHEIRWHEPEDPDQELREAAQAAGLRMHKVADGLYQAGDYLLGHSVVRGFTVRELGTKRGFRYVGQYRRVENAIRRAKELVDQEAALRARSRGIDARE